MLEFCDETDKARPEPNKKNEAQCKERTPVTVVHDELDWQTHRQHHDHKTQKYNKEEQLIHGNNLFQFEDTCDRFLCDCNAVAAVAAAESASLRLLLLLLLLWWWWLLHLHFAANTARGAECCHCLVQCVCLSVFSHFSRPASSTRRRAPAPSSSRTCSAALLAARQTRRSPALRVWPVH